MIPHVNNRGHSFKGVTEYLMNDTPEMSADRERVSWTATSENLLGMEIETAARVMAFTDMNRDQIKAASGQSLSGAKSSAGAVYHYSLAWAKDEAPERDHMEDAARETIEALGLEGHQFYMVAHSDRDHAHVHVVANLTHPETGKRAELGRDHCKLSDWARGYEREHGLKCQAREDNAKKREQGEPTKNRNQKQDYSAEVTRAFMASDSGKAFVHALQAEGLELGKAQRGRGFVIINDRAEIQSLSRQLDIDEKGRAKTKAIAQKLSDLTPDMVRDGDEIAAEIKAGLSHSRETDEREQQNKMLAAADAQAKKLAAAQVAKERKAAEFARHLESVEERQEIARQKLESTLAETIGKRLDQDKQDAQRLKSITEGRGALLSLRRLWQGKKDRELLAGIRQDVAKSENAIKRARADLEKIHVKETAKLYETYEKERLEFKERSAATQIETLEYISENIGERGFSSHNSRGARKPIEQANREKSERIDRQIYQIKEAEHQAQKAADIEAQKIALRPAYERRQAEIEAQKQPEKSATERTIDRIKSNREAGSNSKDRGRDFDRER